MLTAENETWPPWPIIFYFVAVMDDDVGTRLPTWKIDTKAQTVEIDPGDVVEWLHVGFEIGKPVKPSDPNVRIGPEEVPPLTAADVEGVAARYVHWLEAARSYLKLDMARGSESLGRVRRQKPARLTDEWLRLIGNEYDRRNQEGQSAVTEIARAHNVDVSTASRWVKEARRRGHLPPAEKGKVSA
jgi:hypothetical protein